ncbi:vWA domain-containing protein [Nostoc sp. FACHB-133]|uniref:VWA domain-containing protein n=1 Tax=Nostoc sp. FACHB-133 TaxID=2692835 RepID=UPI001686EC93|nr:vWA domain-containing protein [Nostoc sp. FACHB-133]MBD2527681.1 VWA domain-containing protein [Nostoc sp. FACHB-133]
MSRFRRSLWLYPLFQIPLIVFGVCLVATILCSVLTLGRPSVAVAIALDLSSSTYQGQSFNAPNTVMAQEVAAVRSYIEQNSQQLKVPNNIQIFGFGDQVIPLNNSFASDRQKLENELNSALANPNLSSQIGTGTNLSQAIDQGTKALSNIQDRCHELLLVTDGVADVIPSVLIQAVAQKVKINAVVVGADAPQIQSATYTTNGIYISGESNNLLIFFKDIFFASFNSNLKWVYFWRGCTWIAFMWLIILPLDKWVLQGLINLPMNLSGQLALGNALFWTIVIPLILWQLSSLPFFSTC